MHSYQLWRTGFGRSDSQYQPGCPYTLMHRRPGEGGTAQRGSDSLKANDTEGEWLLIFRDLHLSSTQDDHWGGYAILSTLTDHPGRVPRCV